MIKAVLLSIHPKWAEKIYSGEKDVEWRKASKMTEVELCQIIKGSNLFPGYKLLKEENARLNEVLKRHGITMLKDG